MLQLRPGATEKKKQKKPITISVLKGAKDLSRYFSKKRYKKWAISA